MGLISTSTRRSPSWLTVPRVFAALRERWPHETLAIREGISSFPEEWLVDWRTGVAVLHNPSPLDGIHTTLVLKERMVQSWMRECPIAANTAWPFLYPRKC